MPTPDKASLVKKISAVATSLVKYLEKMNAHVARSHAETQEDYLGGGSKIIKPNDSYEFGAILASHKTVGVQPEPSPENMARFEKKPPLSDKPGELAMAKHKKGFKREFPFPKAWQEAARVMNIRYHADAVVQFAKKMKFDIKEFCKQKYKNGVVNLAEFSDAALDAMYEAEIQKPGGNTLYKKFREFLEYEYIKKEHASVNNYKSLVVFNASSWYYSPYQSMTTPFLSAEEAAIVSEATHGNDSAVKFSDTCAVDDIFNIKEEKASKIALIPDPTTYISVPGQKEYFNDVEKMKRQLVEAAGEVYPHVDFTQMGVSDDAFFAQRREDIEKEENRHAGKHAEFSKIDDIPWMSDATNFMARLQNRLDLYFDDSGMENYGYPVKTSSAHTTQNGGLVTGYDCELRVHFNKIDQMSMLGDIYEKGFWLAEMHQQRHTRAVYNFFHIPYDWNVKDQIRQHEEFGPKDKDGNPKMTEEYQRYLDMQASLEDEQFFAHMVHKAGISSPKTISPYLTSLDGLDQKPLLIRNTGISFNNANPDDAFRITTSVEYGSFSYVPMLELNSNQGRYKEIKSESMPVPKNFEEFKEKYIEHMEAIYPAIDIRKMAEMDDLFKLKECTRQGMSM